MVFSYGYIFLEIIKYQQRIRFLDGDLHNLTKILGEQSVLLLFLIYILREKIADYNSSNSYEYNTNRYTDIKYRTINMLKEMPCRDSIPLNGFFKLLRSQNCYS